MDLSAWSREAVEQLGARSAQLRQRHAISERAAYTWDLDTAELKLDGHVFRLVTVGTVAGASFLWVWANEAIPVIAKEGLERVRQFGAQNDLSLLTTDFASSFDRTETGSILFLLFEVRTP
ncbi:MAG: hypothetical protein Q8L48_37810 [Archangium sp.]|nr:hypothetical protein [Archangium sp.]